MDILAQQIDSVMVLGKIKEDGRRGVTGGTLWNGWNMLVRMTDPQSKFSETSEGE